MNSIALVCAGMPVIPLLVYVSMSIAGITSVCKVLVAEVFVVIYIVVIVVAILKKAEAEENIKKKKS